MTITADQITGVSEHTEQYPLLSDEELQALADDIAENGLFDPITVTSEGLLLDGRNRLKACRAAGIEPRIDIYDGDEDQIGAFVRSKNRRRHQPTGSRAMSEALSMQLDGKRENGRWKRGAVDIPNNWNNSSGWREAMNRSGAILDHAPDLASEVVDGTLTLDAAYRQAEENRDRERNRLAEQERLAAEEADAKAFIEENAPDLAARVDGDDLESYVEARDLWNRRNREEAARIRREEEAERKRLEGERQMYRTQAADIADLLFRLDTLTEPAQREFSREALERFPDELPANRRHLHTPEALRDLSAALTEYAAELEAHDA